MYRLAILAIVILALQAGIAAAQEESCGHETAADVIATSAGIAAALSAEHALPVAQLHPGGCFVWQQPGVALTVTGIMTEKGGVQMYYREGKLHELLRALPEFEYGNPFVHPPEPEGEFRLAAQAYVLSAEQSRARLAEYMDGYAYWIELNEGMDFIVPDEDALQTDGALVYIDSGGPVEFHFRYDDEGRLKLRHILMWEFFSA